MNSSTKFAGEAAAARPRIYLAGPDVFFVGADEIFARLKTLCDDFGMLGVVPSDGGLSQGSRPADGELARRIYQGNIDLIRSADGVVANLTRFRGLEPDSGTVFEVGFAIALGKPVVAYGVPDESYADRVGAEIACTRDDQGRLRETDSGATVEGLGQRLNLMLTQSTPIEPTAEAALRRISTAFANSRGKVA